MMNESIERGGAGILVTSCMLGSLGVAGVGGSEGVGRGVGGGVTTFLSVAGDGVGFGVATVGFCVTGGFDGVTGVSSSAGGTRSKESFGIFGTCGTAGIFGGDTGSAELMKILGGGKVMGIVTPGGMIMSLPLQPSGKKYRIFSLRC